MDLLKETSYLLLLLCIYATVTNLNSVTTMTSPDPWAAAPNLLQYDFYKNTCPQVERIIQETVWNLYQFRPEISPALLRLVFHDCFIQGCDASVLLDPTGDQSSEKDSPPNETLRGFDVIDTVKYEIEKVCPGVVSCSDILVLAAREAVLMAGGPFYPLLTGRRDSMISYPELAKSQLPSPDANLLQTLASFASRGFTVRETVSLLGAHSVGTYHCKFIHTRLYNFSGTNQADPSLDKEFVRLMRSRCDHGTTGTAAAPSPYHFLPLSTVGELGIVEEDDGSQARSMFGVPYYRSLLEGQGILYADQQLMVAEVTSSWVRMYASYGVLFRKDFAESMMKLSMLRVLTAPYGQVRLNCSSVAY